MQVYGAAYFIMPCILVHILTNCALFCFVHALHQSKVHIFREISTINQCIPKLWTRS